MTLLKNQQMTPPPHYPLDMLPPLLPLAANVALSYMQTGPWPRPFSNSQGRCTVPILQAPQSSGGLASACLGGCDTGQFVFGCVSSGCSENSV